MAQSQLRLLKSRRLLPLFVTQFLGAVNDNLFKTALVTLITYSDQNSSTQTRVIVALATAIFILPYFLFSATAGQLADKFEKSHLIRYVKLWEIGAMVLAAVGFALDNTAYQLAVLFFLGVQSTFFGPVKYGILPDHLATDELVGGNALIEAGTFLAILIGTIAGVHLVGLDRGPTIVTGALLTFAVLGWIASLFIPKARRATPDLRINPNMLTETLAIIRHANSRRDIRLSIIGISWFWAVGATYLSQLPTYAKETLGADPDVLNLFLTIFSVGIGAGSVLCARLLRGEVSARFAPLGALGMALFTFDLYASSTRAIGGDGQLVGIVAFLSHAANWRLIADLFAIAACGGLFIVPLYTIMQARADESHRSRVVAANNILNAIYIVIAGVISAVMLAAGLTVPEVFLTVGVVNAIAAVVVMRLLPGALLKSLLAGLFRLVYGVQVRGLEHVAEAGERVVIVANHLSFIDGALLATFLPGRPAFAVAANRAAAWWVKPFLSLVDAVPIDPLKPLATKTLIRAVEEGRPCVIFPEGRLTVTGALMKIYEGPAMIADKAKAMILPVRLDGLQYTRFSRLKGKVRRRWIPRVTVTIQRPRSIELSDEIKGRRRRREIGLRLYDIMSSMMFETAETGKTLFQAVLDARHIHGGDRGMLEDIERKPMTYDRLVTGAFVIGRRLAAVSAPLEKVGVLLPNANVTAATLSALHAFRRVPAMLNYSTGAKNMGIACEIAEIRTIVTSRRFVERAKLEAALSTLSSGRRVIYLEDLRAEVTLFERLRGFIGAHFPRAIHGRLRPSADDPAVVLFTSGSEGTPKGVVLSHRNILANCHQLAARVDFNPSDIVFNALPMFHSFGLTGGTILPLISGVKIFLYPSPLHYRIVPELAYDTNATILFGTDTFLTGYARAGHPYDFYSVRYVFAGAERVREETRRGWTERFGLRILEGYGATETAPVLATNTPMHFKAGTVGRLLPGIEARLEPVEGIHDGGRLVVSGPNVMLGYLREGAPGVLEPPAGGWYDTGDIVALDAEGFVTIKGRAKRFAKIAGEMVSLAAVEAQASRLWPDFRHAALAFPDPRKGEQVVLLTENPAGTADVLRADAHAHGIAEVMVPRPVIPVPEIPLLGTGKVDYAGAREVAERSLIARTLQSEPAPS
ncbi:MAG TPA: acyl-[ACP]--phospholipid O-acyltransferase [Stellaceae bacterium]|nr:acyl-[ACP]--phospholipid O-acyltransferase [Stellaceae bacterium]